MKKAVNLLCLLAVLAIVGLIALDFLTPPQERRGVFISRCAFGVLLFLCIPLLFRQFSLAYYRNDIPPKYWLTLYAVMALAFLLIGGKLGAFAAARDLPDAVSQRYETASGVSLVTKARPDAQTILLDGKTFTIAREDFDTTVDGESYVIVYLKHSGFIIDLLDEQGESLLKTKGG